MRHLLVSFYLVAAFSLSAQDPWVKFVDPKSRLAGFKDLSGTIRIAARFENYFVADTFHNIIAVREPVAKSYESYYLLKSGKKTGRDSLYLFDGYDCESDGMIMYKDHNTDYIGYLNANGNAVIPAVYNSATGFRNGFAQALFGAKKRCWEGGDDTTNCERLILEGGRQLLINKQNEILAEGIASDFYQTVDWYSTRINEVPEDTSIYVKVDGKNGIKYYFIHFQKEFQKWFYNDFLASLNTGQTKYLFPEIMIWDQKNGWRSISREAYMKSYSEVLKKERFQTGANKKLNFGQGEFSDYVMTSPVYLEFFTSCGRFDKYRYPFFVVQLSYSKNGKFDHSESFEFIRTSHGYRLMQAPISH
ncbi:MAG: WG repeat-containing protein [Chitinophagaceae bacterium]|nr:WG repeat-containing protein [Chitinophagaceae bacterium]